MNAAFFACTLFFCRIATGTVFAVSALGKLRDLPAFEQAVRRFHLLPTKTVRPVAHLFVLGEATVAVTMLLGGSRLSWGFGLAAILLVLFSIAIGSALRHSLPIACNCFGKSERPVSALDLVRNGGLLGFALPGLFFSSGGNAGVGTETGILLGLMAVAVALAWSRIGDLAELFQAQT